MFLEPICQNAWLSFFAQDLPEKGEQLSPKEIDVVLEESKGTPNPCNREDVLGQILCD